MGNTEIVITNWGDLRGKRIAYKSIGLRPAAYMGMHLVMFKISNEQKFMLAVIQHGITYKETK